MLAQSLSATPLATSYPTTPFSLPPHTTTKSLTYRPTLSIFSLYDKVLRRPVEPADKSGQKSILGCDGLSAYDPTATLAVHCGNRLVPVSALSKYSIKPIRCAS
jgi:hypothetical protein